MGRRDIYGREINLQRQPSHMRVAEVRKFCPVPQEIRNDMQKPGLSPRAKTGTIAPCKNRDYRKLDEASYSLIRAAMSQTCTDGSTFAHR